MMSMSLSFFAGVCPLGCFLFQWRAVYGLPAATIEFWRDSPRMYLGGLKFSRSAHTTVCGVQVFGPAAFAARARSIERRMYSCASCVSPQPVTFTHLFDSRSL